MPGNPELIIKAMDEFANQKDFLINIGSDKGRIVADLIKQHKPHVLVELGGYIGYSAIWFANAMRCVLPEGEKAQLWSLEYEGRFAKIARELIELAGVDDIVQLVVGEAGESLKSLKSEGTMKEGSVDMLFLDHVEDLYEADFKIAWEEMGLLREGTVIVADNVLRPGAPEYRKYVRSQKALKSEGVKGLIIPGDFEVECPCKTLQSGFI